MKEKFVLVKISIPITSITLTLMMFSPDRSTFKLNDRSKGLGWILAETDLFIDLEFTAPICLQFKSHWSDKLINADESISMKLTYSTC